MVSVVISAVMSCGGHLGRVAEGREWVTSNSRASRASKNLLIWPTAQRRSQLTDTYSPMAHTYGRVLSPCQAHAGPASGGGRPPGLTTEVSMLPPLRMPLPLPTNSRSSFASSTTREGCRSHRARNWELSTLLGEGAAGWGLSPEDPDPQPTHDERQKACGRQSS